MGYLAAAYPQPEEIGVKRVLKFLACREGALFGMVVLLLIGFGVTTEGFLDPYSLSDRSRHWVEIGLIAVPMTFIIATGGIDLSVGSLIAMAAVCGGLAWERWESLPVALGLCLLAGGLGGLFNGAVVAWGRLPPLVVTLATMAIFRGIAMGVTGALPISTFPEGFTDWGLFGAWVVSDNVEIPHQIFILLAVVVGGILLFNWHVLGRQCRQFGENATAARFVGISVRKLNLTIYSLCGLVCGLAAINWTARFATAHPGAGQGLELEVIAVVVLGGTRITGGSGSIVGSFLGLLIIGLIRFGLDLNDVKQQYQIILIGILLVVIAGFNEWLARRRLT